MRGLTFNYSVTSLDGGQGQSRLKITPPKPHSPLTEQDKAILRDSRPAPLTYKEFVEQMESKVENRDVIEPILPAPPTISARRAQEMRQLKRDKELFPRHDTNPRAGQSPYVIVAPTIWRRI